MKSGTYRKKFFDDDPSKVFEYLIPLRTSYALKNKIAERISKALNCGISVKIIDELNPRHKIPLCNIDVATYIKNTVTYVLFATDEYSLAAAVKALRKINKAIHLKEVYRIKGYPTVNGKRDMLIIRGNIKLNKKEVDIQSFVTLLEERPKGNIKLVNATGHLVYIQTANGNIPLRSTMKIRVFCKCSDTRIIETKYGDISLSLANYELEGTLPEYREDTFYIVSRITQEVLGRSDLITPDDFVFSKTRRKVCCKQLISMNLNKK